MWTFQYTFFKKTSKQLKIYLLKILEKAKIGIFFFKATPNNFNGLALLQAKFESALWQKCLIVNFICTSKDDYPHN